MAEPNLINTSSCYFKQATFENIASSGGTGTTLVSSTTDKHKKVVSIFFCNTTGSTVQIYMYDSSTSGSRYYLYQVDIPSKSTLVAVTKDTPIHFVEGSHSLVAYASGTGVDCHVNLEEYDDA